MFMRRNRSNEEETRKQGRKEGRKVENRSKA
jgi:hypothetical protein